CRGRRARFSVRGGRTPPDRGALLLHQYRRRGRVLAARVPARSPHGLRPQHPPRRSAAPVGGGPRRDCPARDLRCHGGRDLARTTALAAREMTDIATRRPTTTRLTAGAGPTTPVTAARFAGSRATARRRRRRPVAPRRTRRRALRCRACAQ